MVVFEHYNAEHDGRLKGAPICADNYFVGGIGSPTAPMFIS
jgi:hypothetical protein